MVNEVPLNIASCKEIYPSKCTCPFFYPVHYNVGSRTLGVKFLCNYCNTVHSDAETRRLNKIEREFASKPNPNCPEHGTSRTPTR